jgi:hypothetical protein
MRQSTCLLLVLLAAGCAHSRGRWNAGQWVMCSGADCFFVGALPPRWRVIQQEGAEVGFFDKSVGAAIQGNESCREDADEAPLATLTHHLLVGYTDRRVRTEGLVALDRREALRTVLDARLDGVEVVLDLYVLKKNGCIYDLSLAAPPAGYAAASRDFASFVAGFAGTGHL